MHKRYPLQLLTRYDGSVGSTINISSHSLSVLGSNTLKIGQRLSLVVEWPALLGDFIPLQLVIEGKIVRRNEHYFALRFHTHEFRTVKRLGATTH